MTREELVAAIGIALNDARMNGDDLATATLAAIEAAGCVVVPREATRGMRLSGLDALNTGKGIAAAWVAMIAASPLAPEPRS
jgi:hypothetical protein